MSAGADGSLRIVILRSCFSPAEGCSRWHPPLCWKGESLTRMISSSSCAVSSASAETTSTCFLAGSKKAARAPVERALEAVVAASRAAGSHDVAGGALVASSGSRAHSSLAVRCSSLARPFARRLLVSQQLNVIERRTVESVKLKPAAVQRAVQPAVCSVRRNDRLRNVCEIE